MQTVALKPKRAEWTAMKTGLIVLCVVMMLAPELCLPLALAAPLLACPLLKGQTGQKMLPWLSAAAPACASLAAGMDVFYSLSLALIGLLPLLITNGIPQQMRPGAKGMLLYMTAAAFSLTVSLAAASRALGGPLQLMLAEELVRWVEANENRSQLLNRLAAAGWIAVPEGYAEQGVAGALMQTEHIRQMLMSLKWNVRMMIAQLLPGLFVQGCVITGIFTALRMERVNGVLLVVETKTPAQKQTRVIAPPSFRLLTLSRGLRMMWALIAVTGLVLMTSQTAAVAVAGQMCLALAETVGCLLGAAAMIFLYTQNDPDRRVTAGVLAAALYLFCPFALLALGIADQIFHIRTRQAQKAERTEGGNKQ